MASYLAHISTADLIARLRQIEANGRGACGDEPVAYVVRAGRRRAVSRAQVARNVCRGAWLDTRDEIFRRFVHA